MCARRAARADTVSNSVALEATHTTAHHRRTAHRNTYVTTRSHDIASAGATNDCAKGVAESDGNKRMVAVSVDDGAEDPDELQDLLISHETVLELNPNRQHEHGIAAGIETVASPEGGWQLRRVETRRKRQYCHSATLLQRVRRP